MQCQELHRDELAEQYLNGQLDPAAQDEFEVHILECVQCLRQVEAVQTLRQGLAERAHQIRACSPVERSRFRWQWVTAAALALVVCGLGVIEFQRLKAPRSAKLQVPPSSSISITVGETIEVPASKSSSANSALVYNLPVNGRNHINFRLNDSHVTRDNAPFTGSAPGSGLNLKAQRARSNRINVDGIDGASDSTKGMSASIEPPATTPSMSQQAHAEVPPVGSDETTKELFRLGTITAFPYTFSGFGSSGKGVGSNVNSNALSDKTGGSSSSDPTRAFFRSAMNAYVEKRYVDALEILEEAVKKEPGAPDVNFYLGICRLLEAKPEASIAPLNAVLESKESPLQQAAHFYLAKAYIQTGDLANAESQLKTAAAMPGNLSTEAGLELGRLQALRSQDGKPSAIGTPGPQ
jgi:hypothetical protein